MTALLHILILSGVKEIRSRLAICLNPNSMYEGEGNKILDIVLGKSLLKYRITLTLKDKQKVEKQLQH